MLEREGAVVNVHAYLLSILNINRSTLPPAWCSRSFLAVDHLVQVEVDLIWNTAADFAYEEDSKGQDWYKSG